MSPEQNRLRATLGAHSKWAKTEDRGAATAAARKAFNDRFEHEVDPDGCLGAEERAWRAQHARKAHFTRLALASSRARAARAAARRSSGGDRDA